MEVLNQYLPKRLSIKAYEFLQFALSYEMRKQTEKLDNKVAYILKHYPKASEIKSSTARDWFNKYDMISGVIIEYNKFNEASEALNKKGFCIYTGEYGEQTIMTIKKYEELKAQEEEPDDDEEVVLHIDDVLTNPHVWIEAH